MMFVSLTSNMDLLVTPVSNGVPHRAAEKLASLTRSKIMHRSVDW